MTPWKLLVCVALGAGGLAQAAESSRPAPAPPPMREYPGRPFPAKPHVEPPYAIRPQDIVILYEHADFGGRAVGLDKDTLDLRAVNFNDIASSFKVRLGHQATFYEDINGKGEWFTYNCPSQPIGEKQSDFCELKNLANDIATGYLCELRHRGAHGCVPWWNDRISGVGNIKPADEHQPQGRIDEGHVG
jgi:hypothetical protein